MIAGSLLMGRRKSLSMQSDAFMWFAGSNVWAPRRFYYRSPETFVLIAKHFARVTGRLCIVCRKPLYGSPEEFVWTTRSVSMCCPKHVYVSREAFVWSAQSLSWAALRHFMGRSKSLYGQPKSVVWSTKNYVLCDFGSAVLALFWRVGVLGITTTQPRSNLITMPDMSVKVHSSTVLYH